MSQYKINNNLLIQKLNGKTVLFDNTISIVYTLNETAHYIFSQLKRNVSKKKILQHMMLRYKVKENKLSRDIDEVIQYFVKKKILSPKL